MTSPEEQDRDRPSLQHVDSSASDLPELPPAPNPSSDPELTVVENDSPPAAPQLQEDIFKISPRAAMKLLGGGVETLARLTGDVPPTPPMTSPPLHHMKGMQLEKESIIRSNSQQDLARMRQQSAGADDAQSSPLNSDPRQPIDGVRLRSTPPSLSPSSFPGNEQEPYIIIGEDAQPLNRQHGAITRKFYSKKPPPISVEEYLSRLHRFCPMSTAVYLATSLYIHRLAVEERAIAVTRRNSHRLVLAGLRVAMKALEDQSYPHSKMAKVGGVSDAELARLEISFCFLTNFELVAREDALKKHCDVLRQETTWNVLRAGVPTLTLNKKPKSKVDAGGKENEGT